MFCIYGKVRDVEIEKENWHTGEGKKGHCRPKYERVWVSMDMTKSSDAGCWMLDASESPVTGHSFPPTSEGAKKMHVILIQ